MRYRTFTRKKCEFVFCNSIRCGEKISIAHSIASRKRNGSASSVYNLWGSLSRCNLFSAIDSFEILFNELPIICVLHLHVTSKTLWRFLNFNLKFKSKFKFHKCWDENRSYTDKKIQFAHNLNSMSHKDGWLRWKAQINNETKKHSYKYILSVSHRPVMFFSCELPNFHEKLKKIFRIPPKIILSWVFSTSEHENRFSSLNTL